jgi:hypothetical protein
LLTEGERLWMTISTPSVTAFGRNTGVGSRLWEFPVYFPRNSPVYRYALCGMLSNVKFGLRDFDPSLASRFAVDGTLRFPKLGDPAWQKLLYS